MAHAMYFSPFPFHILSIWSVLKMLLPVGTSSELFSHPPPLFPTSRLYNIRPFQYKDKVRYTVYSQGHNTLNVPAQAHTFKTGHEIVCILAVTT